MFCTQCGSSVTEKDRFCSQCGQPTDLGPAQPVEPTRLTRDTENKKIAGVCSGFARYLDTDPVLIRVIWLIAAFSGGIGVIAYIVAWIMVPKDKPGAVPVRNLSPQPNPH